MHPSAFLQSVLGYFRSRRGCRWSLAPRHCHSSRPALGHDCSNVSTLTSKHSKETRVYLVVSAQTRTSNSSTTRHLFFRRTHKDVSSCVCTSSIAQRRELMIVSSPHQKSLYGRIGVDNTGAPDHVAKTPPQQIPTRAGQFSIWHCVRSGSVKKHMVE